MPLLERSKLYQDVWSQPCTKIAAGLGISSSALKRICTEMDIPTPVAGYWTRVQCGKLTGGSMAQMGGATCRNSRSSGRRIQALEWPCVSADPRTLPWSLTFCRVPRRAFAAHIHS